MGAIKSLIKKKQEEKKRNTKKPPKLPPKPGGNNYEGKYPEAIALYKYDAIDNEELSFDKGDKLYLIGDVDEGDWIKCYNERTKLKGVVPLNYIDITGDIHTKKTYYYDINKVKAENKLQQMSVEEGTFLIRPSSRNGYFALSVRVNENNIWTVKHYLIHHEKDPNKYFMDNGPKHDNFDQMIAFLSRPNNLLNFVIKKPLSPILPQTPFRNFEVDRRNFSMEDKLGQGNFGEVRKAKWGPKARTHVAIKVVKAGKMTNEAFIQEAKVMHELYHENIMRLLAVCTEPRDQDIYIVTEYMEKGDLLSYMRSEDGLRSEFNKLNSFILDVCEGMSYLEGKNYAHCDLRAANILVNEELTAKVADFGLAKLIDESADTHESMMFPVRWTAPEAAQFRKFTTKSDVWSFGVLIFEVITYGGVPYKGLKNSEVRQKVEREDYRLPNPHDAVINVRKCLCPTVLYNIMLECWNKVAENRPTFDSLKDRLNNIADEDANYS